ncbi:hypothetical protein BT96DRAFT_919680, partial [Gymnopus androsaceus JB14]
MYSKFTSIFVFATLVLGVQALTTGPVCTVLPGGPAAPLVAQWASYHQVFLRDVLTPSMVSGLCVLLQKPLQVF